MRLVLSRQARADLAEIKRYYLAEGSPEQRQRCWRASTRRFSGC
jgi:plasmid stabilization system protein ParE